MPRFAMEYRVVEIHFHEVEADSIDEAKTIVCDQDLQPQLASRICKELDTYEEIEGGADMLSPTEYFELRGGES